MSCFSLSCRIVTLNCLHLFKLHNLFTCVSLFDLSWPFHVFFLRWSVGRSLWKRLSCYHAWHFWFSGLFIFSQFPGRIYPFFLSAVFCSSFSLPVQGTIVLVTGEQSGNGSCSRTLATWTLWCAQNVPGKEPQHVCFHVGFDDLVRDPQIHCPQSPMLCLHYRPASWY